MSATMKVEMSDDETVGCLEWSWVVSTVGMMVCQMAGKMDRTKETN